MVLNSDNFTNYNAFVSTKIFGNNHHQFFINEIKCTFIRCNSYDDMRVVTAFLRKLKYTSTYFNCCLKCVFIIYYYDYSCAVAGKVLLAVF